METSPLQLLITRQTCLAQEKVEDRGTEKNLHIVVKNTPFHLQAALQSNGLPTKTDFNQIGVETSLVYDTDEMKTVDFVKLKPLETKTKQSDNANQLTLELRLKVLTSQLEDMYFKVKLTAYDIRTKVVYPNICAYSHPIKVISKPDQIRKRKPKKKTANDLFSESLSRIENQQKKQLAILESIKTSTESMKNMSLQEPASESMVIDQAQITHQLANMFPDFSKANPQVVPAPESVMVKSEPEVDFDSSYRTFLKAFTELKPEDRVVAIRRVSRNNGFVENEILRELLDLFQGEVFQQELGHEVVNKGTASLCELGECDHDDSCPHKAEYRKIDQLYNYTDFLLDDIPIL